MTFTIGAYHS